MKDRTHFASRIDCWDDDGENIVEHLAGVEDFKVALATFKAGRLRALAECGYHPAPRCARHRG